MGEPTIEYKIIVEVDGDQVYTETQYSGDSACEAVGRAERYVKKSLIDDEEEED